MRLMALPCLSALLLFSGCFLEGGLGYGGSAQADVTSSSPGLDEALADAEVKLLEAGIPVEGNFPCVELKIKSSGMVVFEAAASGSFDPVMALVDKEGIVLAVNDDWGNSVDSRIVMAEVPSGARLLVWGVNGDQGTAAVSVSEGTSQDLEEWTASATIATGTMESRLLDNKENECIEDLVDDLDEDEIYITDWENALFVPFTVTSEGYHSITLESEDFDSYLVVVSIERGRTEFVAMNDDGGTDWNSRLLLELEPGLYGAILNSYASGEEGRFTLAVEPVEIGEGEINWVEVPGSGEGVISDEELAMVFWPGIDNEWHFSSITSTTPVSAFGFVIEQQGFYSLSAASELDCTLTLLGYESPEEAYCLDFNDDFDDWNPRLTLELEPGTYLALVAPYDGVGQSDVTFTVEPGTVFVTEPVLLPVGGVHELRLERGVPYGLFTLDMVGGYNYAISAESQELDAVITITFADGSELFDDDGGDGLNSYIEFVPTAGQLGAATLRVESLAEGEGGLITVSFERLNRLSESESFSLYD